MPCPAAMFCAMESYSIASTSIRWISVVVVSTYPSRRTSASAKTAQATFFRSEPMDGPAKRIHRLSHEERDGAVHHEQRPDDQDGGAAGPRDQRHDPGRREEHEDG